MRDGDEIVEMFGFDDEKDREDVMQMLRSDVTEPTDEAILFHRHGVDEVLGWFDAHLDDDGYVRWDDGSYAKPHVFARINEGRGTFCPVDCFRSDSSYVRDDVESDRLHVDHLYGVAGHAGSPVFVLDHWYSVFKLREVDRRIRLRSAWTDTGELIDSKLAGMM